MRHKQLLLEKIGESLAAVLPITAIVLVISVTIAPLTPGTLVLFLFGALLLVLGMGLFTLGVDMSMIPMGDGIGVQISKAKRIGLPLLVCFILGVVVTVAEPDLQVLADQLPSVDNMTLILAVAVGVGFFLVVAQVRMLLNIPLSYTLLFFYAIVFILSIFVPDSFIPAAFDSGGVTTGPITVPFIMALGIGMAAIRSDKNSSSDSFGLISLCSIGPILSVMILGIVTPDLDAAYTPVTIPEVATTRDAARVFVEEIPAYVAEVAMALLPIIILFALFQLIFRRFQRHQLGRILVGLVYTYVGLVLFLVGVNVGFMPAGATIGAGIATGGTQWLLVPIGALVGYFIVRAEPAVQVLARQVEEISNGSITQKAINHALSIGIALSVGLAMVRILTGISILWFLVPGYAVALGLTFFVPQMFTGVAFDSGGVASGPMTTTFLLPLAMGACEALGGNILTDAFGIVALVAMTPLLTIQLLGLYSKLKARSAAKALHQAIRQELAQLEDGVIYWEV
ncbi:MAG: DUF1538 domain-containing protein [Candidatus Enterenecus sp.]